MKLADYNLSRSGAAAAPAAPAAAPATMAPANVRRPRASRIGRQVGFLNNQCRHDEPLWRLTAALVVNGSGASWWLRCGRRTGGPGDGRRRC